MSTPSSQGSFVSFNGVVLGRVTNWRLQPGSASFEEVTNVTSTVLGSGDNARVVKQFDCTSVDPGGVDVSLFGVPPFAAGVIGKKGILSVTYGIGSTFAMEAFLETIDGTANVGEFLTGTARFRFTGSGWTN